MRKLTTIIGLVVLAHIFPSVALTNPLGNAYVAGRTWFDQQHNGSCGRMVAVSTDGLVHVVWTELCTPNPSHARSVRYNVWDPDSASFVAGNGIPLDSSARSGYVTLAITQDVCPLPAYHGWNPATNSQQSCVNLCANHTVYPPARYEAGQAIYILWPQIARSVDGTVHLISEESNAIGEYENRVYYSRGVASVDSVGNMELEWQDFGGSGFDEIALSCNVANAIACSRHTNRIARAWLQSTRQYPPTAQTPFNNDVFVQISDDDGATWNAPINLTSFVAGDTACYIQTQNWRVCSLDTFRAFQEISLLFDESDVLHVAFTTIGYYTWNANGVTTITMEKSRIWHWNEASGQFSLVVDGWFDAAESGAYRYNAQKPSLAIDTQNGRLYCAFVRIAPDELSEGGFPNGDVWINASTDGGSNWSVGVNVTRTTPAVLPAPAGESLSECDPTLAEMVTDGILHLTYLIDRDAGPCWYDEGVYTLNDFIYQRVPTDSIPVVPFLQRYPLHYDSSGFADARPPRHQVPESFTLHAPYPNPFNNRTVISFALPRESDVSLRVFDVLGREVETLMCGKQPAGVHTLEWSAVNCASGVYLIVLEQNAARLVRKAALLR